MNSSKSIPAGNQCPMPVIPFGSTVEGKCSRDKASSCEYQCNEGYEKDLAISTISCTENGSWKEDLFSLCKSIFFADSTKVLSNY